MSKPKLYGSQRSCLPNSRADIRRRKLWEHNRQIAQKKSRERRESWKERFYANRSD